MKSPRESDHPTGDRIQDIVVWGEDGKKITLEIFENSLCFKVKKLKEKIVIPLEALWVTSQTIFLKRPKQHDYAFRFETPELAISFSYDTADLHVLFAQHIERRLKTLGCFYGFFLFGFRNSFFFLDAELEVRVFSYTYKFGGVYKGHWKHCVVCFQKKKKINLIMKIAKWLWIISL